jgi:acyl-CoA synthetase (AMP-forming)/AMP-acid ligase II
MSGTPTDVATFLLERGSPGRIALRFADGEYSYATLRQRVDDVARAIVGMGAPPGARALLIDENSFFQVVAYLGVMRAGLAAVPLPSNISSDRLAYVRKSTEAELVFARSTVVRADGTFDGVHLITDRESPPVRGLASQRSFGEIPDQASAPGRDLPEVGPDALAAIMFTSGSTGDPRGVMVSHRNIIANTESIVRFLELGENDRVMVVLPFHYCFGASLLHTHLRVGGSLVVDMRFMYPEVVLQRMIETGCTGFAGVPSHFNILLAGSGLATKSFPSLRYVQQAGGRLAPASISKLRRALPAARVFVMYGQTEATARLSYLPPERLETKAGSVGKGIPGVTIRVVDEAGRDVRPGELGEIVAAGESIACGYWRAPEASAEVFRDGVLHTGDIATVDEDGFVYIVDRAGEFLKIGGERVSSRRIEDELASCDEVLEASVLPIPDDVLGEAVRAFVVPGGGNRDGLEKRVEAFCRRRMPAPLVPREIIVVESLPRNAAGKVIKSKLKTFETTTRA